jgi:senataxin
MEPGLLDDIMPANRDPATAEEVDKDEERTGRFDMPALLLRYLVKFTEANSLTHELNKDHLRMALRVARHRGLNDQQMKGFKEAVGSQYGVACIYGPPGSGKTRVIGAIAVTEALLSHQLGNRRPVLVCAPANSHVDNVMDEVLANLPEGHDLETTRFKGGYTRDNSMDESENMSIDSGDAEPSSPESNLNGGKAAELKRAMGDSVDESAPSTVERNHDYMFYDTRLRKIKQWAATRGAQVPHPMADVAVAYLELMPKVRAGKGNMAERKKRRSDMDDLLWLLTRHYVAHTVDMLFCTNIAAADEILRTFGRFRVILQEESLEAFVVDDARPLAMFKETCELLVLVGSEKPHNNVSMTKGASKDINLPEASLFDIFVRDRLNADSVVALDVQYRMHPQLSKPVNNIFYGGNMRDAPSCSAESEVYNTWEHYLQGLKPAWNGNRRLAIDVSGDGIESHRSDDGASWVNEAEAQFFCDLVRGALDAEVPENGRPLTCADFLGVVFYGAQEGVISEKMFRFHINKSDSRITVEKMHNVQGAEGEIVLLSFARNIPDMPLDIGVIGRKFNLRIALSRAKQSMVVIGNIRAWCQEKINGNKLIADKKSKMSYFGSYIQDIIDENDGISYGDVQRFLNGEDITEAEFPKLLKPKLDGMRLTRRDRAAAVPDDAFARLELESRIEQRGEEEARRRRRLQNLRNASN